MTTLRQAAIAVVVRWDSPAWSDLPTTGKHIAVLRKALEAPEQEPAAWINITQHGSTTTIDNTFDDRVMDWPLGEYKLYVGPVEAPDIEALTKERDALMLGNRDLVDWFDALRADHDALMAAGKLALSALDEHEGNYKLNDAGCDRQNAAITALKQTGIQ